MMGVTRMQSFKKYFFIAAFSASSFAVCLDTKNPFIWCKRGLDWLAINVYGSYREISPLYHPYTHRAIEELKKEHEEAFRFVDFYIGAGPSSRYQSIYLPLEFIERFEKEHQEARQDGLYSQAFKMIMLHEAGHIKHYDIPLMTSIAIVVSCWQAVMKLGQDFSHKPIKEKTFFDRLFSSSVEKKRLILKCLERHV